MPNRILILKECVQQLQEYSRWRFAVYRGYRDRARFIAEILQHALDESSLDTAEAILRDQMRLLTANPDPNFSSPNRELYQPHGDSKFTEKARAFNREDKYYVIIHETLQKLVTEGSTPNDLAGVNLTHRIWLGAPLTNETITKIKCANNALAKKWHHKTTKQPVKLKHYIWTDRRDLLLGTYPIPNTEFKDIMTLFDSDSPLRPIFYSFCSHKEYAFASDLARFQACHKYGGLFLGISWSAGVKKTKKKIFAPDMGSVYFFTLKSTNEIYFPQPFSDIPHKQLLHNLYFSNRSFHEKLVSHYFIDSELIYFGRPLHPLCRLIIEYQEKYLLALGEHGVPHVINDYRRIIHDYLPNVWFKTQNEKTVSKAAKELIHNTRTSNLALITNVIPLEQALIDLGYIYIIPAGIMDYNNPFATWNTDNAFMIKLENNDLVLTCPLLDIYRNISQSWLKINLSSKLTSEI